MKQEANGDDEFSEYLTKLRKLLPTQYHPLLEFDSVRRYLRRSFRDRSGGITPNTGKMYIQRLADFCEQEKRNPDEIVENAQKESRLVKRHLENWFDSMLTNQDRDTAIGKINTVLGFLGRNDVDRESIGYKIPQRKGQKEKDYPFCPTRDQLLKAFNLDVWKIKELGKDMQLFLLAESQSGLSEVDLLTLDIRDDSAARWAGFKDYECIDKQLAKGKDPVSVVIRRTKEQGALQITFFGIEVIERLDRRKTRLFGFPEDGRNLRKYFEIVQETLHEPKFATHSLRRYFETCLEAAGLNQKSIDRMMGHGLRDIGGRYSGLRPEDLEPMYERAYTEKLRLIV